MKFKKKTNSFNILSTKSLLAPSVHIYLEYMYFIENERRFSINFTTIVDQVNFSNSLRTLHLTCVGILNV